MILRALIRSQDQLKATPMAMIIESRTIQSTPSSGARAGYDGAKHRKGAKVHASVDSLGNLLAVHIAAANERDRAPAGTIAKAAPTTIGQTVTLG